MYNDNLVLEGEQTQPQKKTYSSLALIKLCNPRWVFNFFPIKNFKEFLSFRAAKHFPLLSAQLDAALILFCSAQASKALQGALHPADWNFGITLTEQTIRVVLGFLSLGSWQEMKLLVHFFKNWNNWVIKVLQWVVHGNIPRFHLDDLMAAPENN